MRTTLGSLSVLLLLGAGGPVITAAQDSATLAMPVFEVDPTWPRLPNNWVMGDPSSIAVDRHDNVWILHRPRTVPAEKKDHAAPPVLDADGAAIRAEVAGTTDDAGAGPAA